MKFGPVPVARAEGAVLAHALKRPGVALRKGVRLDARDLALLEAAGVGEVVVAVMEPGDVEENEAARVVAQTLAGPYLRLDPPFTGRCNILAHENGVLLVDAAAIGRLNDADESVTVATLAPFQRVAAGDMAATVKIIPFAIPAALLHRTTASVAAPQAAGGAPLRLAPFRPMRIGVVSTLAAGLKSSTVEKTLDALVERLEGTGSAIATEARAPHETAALAEALRRIEPLSDLMIVFGASAITDRRDVAPAAIEKAGGRIAHFGMPVDPGNLLLLGHIGAPGAAAPGGKPVIVAPGCARSPKENGFDFVLNRLLAGLAVSSADIRRMGVGGLLNEIAQRPQPRRSENG